MLNTHRHIRHSVVTQVCLFFCATFWLGVMPCPALPSRPPFLFACAGRNPLCPRKKCRCFFFSYFELNTWVADTFFFFNTRCKRCFCFVLFFVRTETKRPKENKGMGGTGSKDDVTETRFEFDRVFRPDSTQEGVFEAVGPLVTSVLDG